MNNSDSLTDPVRHRAVLGHLGIASPVLLGKGMEGYVYDFSEDQVVKIWIQLLITDKQLTERKELLERIGQHSFSFAMPRILDLGTFENLMYSVESKLVGTRADHLYSSANDETRQLFLDQYFGILPQLQQVQMHDEYGDLLSGWFTKTQSENWRTVLFEKLEKTRHKCQESPDHDIGNLDRLFEQFYADELPTVPEHPDKTLVHGDLFLENVLVSDDGQITALLDFSNLSLVGDHLLDVASLIYSPTLSEGVDQDAEDYLLSLARQQYDQHIDLIRVYHLYYCLLFINCQTYEPRTYRWSTKWLRHYGYL